MSDIVLAGLALAVAAGAAAHTLLRWRAGRIDRGQLRGGLIVAGGLIAMAAHRALEIGGVFSDWLGMAGLVVALYGAWVHCEGERARRP